MNLNYCLGFLNLFVYLKYVLKFEHVFVYIKCDLEFQNVFVYPKSNFSILHLFSVPKIGIDFLKNNVYVLNILFDISKSIGLGISKICLCISNMVWDFTSCLNM